MKGTSGLRVYGATKAAIRNFVRAWTVELKDRRIRPDVRSPGPTETLIISFVTGIELFVDGGRAQS